MFRLRGSQWEFRQGTKERKFNWDFKTGFICDIFRKKLPLEYLYKVSSPETCSESQMSFLSLFPTVLAQMNNKYGFLHVAAKQRCPWSYTHYLVWKRFKNKEIIWTVAYVYWETLTWNSKKKGCYKSICSIFSSAGMGLFYYPNICKGFMIAWRLFNI